MLHAVLFDLDNTLIDRERAFRDCVDAAFSDATVRAEILQLDDRGHGPRGPLLNAWERHAGSPMTQLMLGNLIADQLQPDRGLLNALHALAASMKLGIVTNGGSETQRRKIRVAGLSDVIPRERVWVSAEVGKAKPNREIFQLALQGLDVSAGDCLFIGDHERNDIAGAIAAGLRAFQVKTVLDGERLEALMNQERAR
jgi:putative hydrolase of the HAD superfamily